MNKTYSDLCIYIAECLKDVDNIHVNWRVLMAYLHGFENDNKVEVKVVDRSKQYKEMEEAKKSAERVLENIKERS